MSAPARKKSCVPCRQSKARCSLGAPCRRCEERTLECAYDHVPVRQSHRPLRPNDTTSSHRTHPYKAPDHSATSADLSTDHDTDIDDELRGQLDETHEPTYQERFSPSFPLDWEGLLSPSTLQPPFPHCASDFLDPMPQLTRGHSIDASFPLLQTRPEMPTPLGISWLQPDSQPDSIPEKALGCPAIDFSRHPHHRQTSGDERLEVVVTGTPLSPKRSRSLEACFTSKVILGQLLSYPLLLIRGNRLPGFLFPPCALEGPNSSMECSSKGYHQCLPEALAICCNLVHSFETRTAGSASFVWKNIYAEVARLEREHSKYCSKGLLEALQAVTIYLLLQASDLPSTSQNDPGAIVSAIAAIVSVLPGLVMSKHDHATFNYEDNHPHPKELNRKDWVFLESYRRTVCLLYGIELLVHVNLRGEPQGPCGGFDFVQLPSGRYLWEGVSGDEWKARYKSFRGRGGHLKSPLNVRELRRAKQVLPKAPHKDSSDGQLVSEVAQWCESLDEFGTMVWMAAMLDSGS